jgi:hypothetical protein
VKTWRRSLVAVLSGTLIAASLLAGTGSAQLPAGLLPSLTPELLLEIANVEAPPAGIGLQVHADFPDENPLLIDGLAIHSFTADLTPEGGVITRSAHTGESAGGASVDGLEECDDPAFTPTGVKWSEGTMPILWRLDRRSTPEELKFHKTKLTIRSAHRVWPQAQTSCNSPDKITFAYNYLGHTSKNPKYDHVNLVDFGGLGGGALAVNYTWYSGKDIVEVDLRLNKEDYSWTNVDGVHMYQVKNVVAHELGHQFGLDDLSDPHGGLTMYARIGKGEMGNATLGEGDLRGAQTLSP